MRLKRENAPGNIMRDHRSMVFTSVRSGILILSCEERRRRRPRLAGARCSRPAVLCLRYWIPDVSNVTEFRASARLVVTSLPATSLWISRVVRRMLPWGSACEEQRDQYYGMALRIKTFHNIQVSQHALGCLTRTSVTL